MINIMNKMTGTDDLDHRGSKDLDEETQVKRGPILNLVKESCRSLNSV